MRPESEVFGVFLMDDKIRLNISLDMPPDAPVKCPLVIIIHGFTGHMEERHILAVSEMLNDIGCATLRVDMYGHGGSDGEFRNHTLFKWMTNAMSVIDYARSLDFVTDLYLCGHSQGGLTVILAAAMKHDVIAGIIPLSPATNIPDCARRGNLFGIAFDPDHIPEEVRSPNGWVLNGNYLRTAQTVHAEEAIDGYAGPVLIVHGEADETVPVQYAVDAAARYADVTLCLVTGDTHCFDLHLDQAVEAVKGWMLERL